MMMMGMHIFFTTASTTTTLLIIISLSNSMDLGPDGPIVRDESDVCQVESDCDTGDFATAFDKPTNKVLSSQYLLPNWVHVSIVACGDRRPETTVSVKAITLSATGPIYFHIFTERELEAEFHKEFLGWPAAIQEKFRYRLYPITYPPGRFDEWKKVFKTCATQRLFIPVLLTNVDSLLYIDTDIIVLRPVQDLWAHFKKFNSTQLAAMSPEHESPNSGWYNRFARHPYYGELGINSGVMLMNLTRIRQFPWLDHIEEYYSTYKYNITWGDQDLLNILFHHYPQFLYIYDCSWNYRPDHCMYMSGCRPAEEKGISVAHGNRGTLHSDKQPVFRELYQAILQHKFSENLESLVDDMDKRMDELNYEMGRCFAQRRLFTKLLHLHALHQKSQP